MLSDVNVRRTGWQEEDVVVAVLDVVEVTRDDLARRVVPAANATHVL